MSENVVQMRARLGARQSKSYKQFDFPDGTRERGWGILCDEIWFYEDPPRDSPLYAALYAPENWSADSWEPLQWGPGGAIAVDPDGTIRRWDSEEDRWLRLYLRRRMLWTPWFMVRLHKFFSGDDKIHHDHPWDFWTFPLSTYRESVQLPTGELVTQEVEALRLHRRDAEHRHIVLQPREPFWTVVICGKKRRKWGFWPDHETFIPFEEWTSYE